MVLDQTFDQLLAEPVYAGLQPSELWLHFAALNQIPRQSGNEGQASWYVKGIADSVGAAWESDTVGNTVVRVNAATGYEAAPAVCVQAHLDMVCDKDAGVRHDFLSDPTRPCRKGSSIYASGTTLGADNGIGVAAALALLTTPGLKHGPLELLFTVDEERGLVGALGLSPSLLRSKTLINLDSEDEGVLTIGSAGGQDTHISLPIPTKAVNADSHSAYAISVSGLKGGHSGVEIGEGRANALQLLTALIDGPRRVGVNLRVASISGGTADNAIPHSAQAVVVTPTVSAANFQEKIGIFEAGLEGFWRKKEPGLAISVNEVGVPAEALESESSDALISLLATLPHGPLKMLSDSRDAQVETSANLAIVDKPYDQHVRVIVSTRSFDEDSLRDLEKKLSSISTRFGATAKTMSGYPAWKPEPLGSELVSLTAKLYKGVYRHEPEIEAVHAGLECGAIAAAVPDLRAISFGPRILGAHTTKEHVLIPTVLSTWQLLTRLLTQLASAEQE